MQLRRRVTFENNCCEGNSRSWDCSNGACGAYPQAISVLGGFRPQGKNISSAIKAVDTALALLEAGCFSVVLECVPAPVAAAATSALKIPTIGIGAGPFCSGQVLVYHDLLGMLQHLIMPRSRQNSANSMPKLGMLSTKLFLNTRKK